MQVVLAYRQNGCLVGILQSNLYFDALESDRPHPFSNLMSPVKQGGPIRDVYIVEANITDEDDLADIEDLILDIGGQSAGFQAAELANHYLPADWNLATAAPYEAVVDVPKETPASDLPYLKDGVLTCAVCGETNCPWMEIPQQ